MNMNVPFGDLVVLLRVAAAASTAANADDASNAASVKMKDGGRPASARDICLMTARHPTLTWIAGGIFISDKFGRRADQN